jgi:hypothetical protein
VIVVCQEVQTWWCFHSKVQVSFNRQVLIQCYPYELQVVSLWLDFTIWGCSSISKADIQQLTKDKYECADAGMPSIFIPTC